MRRVSNRYADDDFTVDASEDDSSSPLEIDLLDPRSADSISPSHRQTLFPFCRPHPSSLRSIARRLKKKSVGKTSRSVRSFVGHHRESATKQRTRRHSEVCRSAEQKIGDNSRVEGDCEETGIPRIIRAIRRHSEIVKAREDPGCSRRVRLSINSKSSVVPLYDVDSARKSSSPSPTSKRPPVRVSKSEKTLVSVALPAIEKRRSAESTKPVESPETASSPRRQRRRRRVSRFERKRRPIGIRWPTDRADRSKQTIGPCRSPDEQSSPRYYMDQRLACPRQVETQQEYEDVSRLDTLMQQARNNLRHGGDIETFDANGTRDEHRIFPFRETASGNLKIVPNQVVFESKKVSVLVADPRRTRVNVKAEIGKEANETAVIGEARRPLEPRNLSSEGKMDENRPVDEPSVGVRTLSVEREVPLSSLGFTGEQPIDWQNITLPEKTDLYRELARRITNYKNADCIVRLGQDEFHCHLLVLQCYSSYFDDKNSKEVDLTGSNVTSKAFGIIYDWMISPTRESRHLLRRDNILEIFTAAQELGIKELEEQCWAFIDNDELFTEDTAFLLYLEARKIGNTAVMELMVPRIMKFFLMLVSTRDFLELSIDELCLLLRSNYICVNSEMEVLMSAVRWLMHDWQSRKRHMIRVLECVRFGLIAPWQLIDVKRNPENPEFIELVSYPEVQKMVDDGLAFVIIKYWYGNQTEDYYHWIDLLGLTEPTNRNWAGEDKNYVTYREFLLYLEEYRRTKIPELRARKSEGSPRCGKVATDTGNAESPAVPSGIGWILGTGNASRKERHNGFPFRGLGGATGGTGGHPELPGMTGTFNNFGKPERQTERVTSGCSSAMRVQGLPPLPLAGVPMPPEILGRYLSSFEGTAKGTPFRNCPRQGPRKNSEVDAAALRCQRRSCDTTITRGKTEEPVDERKADRSGEDSCKSEDDAATTIQAVYRGYRARNKYHEIRKNCSEDKRDEQARKIGQPIAAESGDKVATRACSVGKTIPTERRDSRIPRGSPSNKRQESRTKSDAFDRHAGETGDSVRTIHRNGIFHSFDDKTSSASENTDTETDLFSPVRTKSVTRLNSAFPRNENPNDRRSKDTLLFPTNEAVIVFGGLDPHREYGIDGNSGKDAYRFEPSKNEWEYVGEIPEPRHRHSTVYLKGRVYLVGGADPRNDDEPAPGRTVVGTVWSFDPNTRAWFAEADLSTPRRDFGLVVSNGVIYAIGGRDKNGLALKSVEAFDPSKRQWREVSPMNAARIGPAAAKYRQLIWVGGGATVATRSRTKRELPTREVECYDPLNDRWLRGEPLRSPRCFASMYVVGDRLYVIGGASETCGLDEMTAGTTESIGIVDVWERESLAWRRHGEIGIARHGHAIGSIGDQLLVIGGQTSVYATSLKSVECYCTRAARVIKGASSLPRALSGHACVTLPAQNVFTTV